MIAKAAAVLQKDLLTAIRSRNGLLLSAFSPAAQLLTFFFLSRAVGPQFRPEGMPYFTFLLIGTGFYIFLLASMHGFLNVIQESQQTGTLEVLMTTATPPIALLCLAALSACGTAFVQFVFYVAAGLCLFPGDLHASVPGVAIVLALSVLIAISFGIFAAGLQVTLHKGSAVLWLFGSSAWVLAGTLFPIGTLPAPVRLLSQCLPLTHSLTGMRLAVLGGAGPALNREMAILLLSASALLPASLAFFSWTVRRARQLGTLSVY
jgi:ABC-2 type transport system permease protein